MSNETKAHWYIYRYSTGETGEMLMIPNTIMWGPYSEEDVFTMEEIKELRRLKEIHIEDSMGIEELREVEKNIKKIVVNARIPNE